MKKLTLSHLVAPLTVGLVPFVVACSGSSEQGVSGDGDSIVAGDGDGDASGDGDAPGDGDSGGDGDMSGDGDGDMSGDGDGDGDMSGDGDGDMSGDGDGDGDGDGPASCVDEDDDGYGENCEAGPDCDDEDETVFEEVGGYLDEDQDGEAGSDQLVMLCTDGSLPDDYVADPGEDCDDGNDALAQELTGYVDNDGDGVAGNTTPVALCTDGTLPVGYDDTPATDCNDSDRDNWTSCQTCVDADDDSYWTGCDSYNDRTGPDCNDGDVNNQTSCATCLDGDSDGYFLGCDAYTTISGPDCNDSDTNNWASCGTCVDDDDDGRYVSCDRFETIDVDCDDEDANNWDSCGDCEDQDDDHNFVGCDAYTTISGPDCDDSNPLRSTDEPEIADNGADDDCSGADLVATTASGIFIADGDTNCDDNGTGTRAVPYCTLSAAFDDYSAGDFFVAQGTYTLSGAGASLTGGSVPIALYGGYDESDWSRDVDLNTTVINLDEITGYGLQLHSERTIVNGFTITGTASLGGTISIAHSGDRGYFVDNTANWDSTGSLVRMQVERLGMVRDSEITANVPSHFTALSFGAIDTDATQYLVYRNAIEVNSAIGAQGLISADGDIVVANNTLRSTSSDNNYTPVIYSLRGNVDAVNNSIAVDWYQMGGASGSSAILYMGWQAGADRVATVVNNAFYANQGIPRLVETSTYDMHPWVLAYNNHGSQAVANIQWTWRWKSGDNIFLRTVSELNACSYRCQAGGNQLGALGFNDWTTADFTPASGAGFVDAGIDPSTVIDNWALFAETIDGATRPLGGVWDAGAFEK